MTAYAIYLTAAALAGHGLTDSDMVTRADMDAAADLAGVARPDGPHERDMIRAAVDTITDTA